MRLHLNNSRALTLLELLITLILTTIIAISIFSIDLFGRYHLINVDRRRRVQNQVSDVLEHMSRNIINAIGNFYVTGTNPVNIPDSGTIEIYVDRAPDGGVGDGQSGTPGDLWIAYIYNDATYKVEYCANYDNASGCNVRWEDVGKNITVFYPSMQTNDTFVTVDITACWDPSEQPCHSGDSNPCLCGSGDNPSANMKARFNLPSVAQR